MQEFILTHEWIIWLAIAWTIPWKGVALWKAARNSHKAWFVVLLLLNTLAILDILYIFIFGRREKDNSDQNQSYTNYPTDSPGGANLIRGL
jgi:hypothetical protein